MKYAKIFLILGLLLFITSICFDSSKADQSKYYFFEVHHELKPQPTGFGPATLYINVVPHINCENIVLQISKKDDVLYNGPETITLPYIDSIVIFKLDIELNKDTSGIQFYVGNGGQLHIPIHTYWVVERDTIKSFNGDPRTFLSTQLRNKKQKVITVEGRRMAEGGPIDPDGVGTSYYTDGKGNRISEEEYRKLHPSSSKVYAEDEGLDDTAYVWQKGDDGLLYQIKKSDLPTKEEQKIKRQQEKRRKLEETTIRESTIAASYVQYEIKEVIKIGPLNRATYDPIKWSPNDSLVSYFAYGYLMLADTLGEKREVAKLDMPPHCVEWLSPKEIVVSLRSRKDKQVRSKLVKYNIDTGEAEDLTGCERRLNYPPGPGQTSFEGPYLTLEGNAYFFTDEETGKVPHIIPSSYKKISLNSENHFYRYNPVGLYIVRTDLKDSVFAFTKSYTDTVDRFDRAYIFNRNKIIRLSDSSVIDLMPYVGNYPDGTLGCGFDREALNPNIPEVLFWLSCDDGVNYIVNRIGVFDYYEKQFTILDTLIGIDNCQSPKYDHSGKNIAFFADGNIYIIKRRAI